MGVSFSNLLSCQLIQEWEPSTKTNIFEIIDRKDWMNVNDLPWDNIDEINFVEEKLMKISRKNMEFILSRCGKHLKKLVIMDLFNPSIIPVLKEHCYNLKTLGLFLFSLNKNDIIRAFEHMEKLDSIALYVSRNQVGTATFDFSEILRSLPKGLIMIELSPSMQEHLTSAETIPNLQISLDKFSCLRNLILKMFKLDNHVIEEISKQKSLEYLSFECCIVKTGTLFPLNLPNLLGLELRKMTNIDNCLINIANESKNLNNLDIRNCQNISTTALRQLVNLENLECLNISGVTSMKYSIILSIVNECKKLKSLFLARCINISEYGFESIANLKNLEELDVSQTHLNSTALIGIANNCTKLKVLSLGSCNNVSVAALKKLRKLINLQTLNVSYIENIMDSVLLELRNLKNFYCQSCQRVTDVGIKYIIKNSPNLKNLIVFDTGITFNSLDFAKKMVKDRKNNITLNFYANASVTCDSSITNSFGKFESPLLKIHSR